MVSIVEIYDGPQLAQVRRLLEAYAATPGIDLCLQGFREELDGLPGRYAPPEGCLLLAEHDGQATGCVALRRLDAQACEMKRLYVWPAFRGRNIGRALAEAVLERAKGMGYTCMRLDTLPSMVQARGLYASLGFREIAPYGADPVEGAICMERDLTHDRIKV